MIFYPDCDYFNENRDDEFSPYPDECEDCYRYEICREGWYKEIDSKGVERRNGMDICENCKGTGYVGIGPGIRGVKKCPCCDGAGKIKGADSTMTYAEIVYDIVKSKSERMDAIYEDYVLELVGATGIEVLLKHKLLETCGVVNGRQLYVVCEKKGEFHDQT